MKKAQIQPEDAKCIECRESITNPICPVCLAKEMKNWKPSIRKYLTTPEYNNNGVNCLICGKGMSICAHCFCRDVYDDLMEEEPEIAEEFVDMFDFRLREELF